MMSLEYTPYIWPFICSFIITVVLGVYAYGRRHVLAATTFTWLMVTLAIWTFCYTMELLTTTLEGKTFWAQAKYFGAAPGPIVWFILSLQLTQNDRWLNLPLQLALGAFGIITIFVVFTNSYHHWFWTSVEMVAGFPETQAEHGFYFWVYAGISYFLILVSLIIYFLYYRTTPAIYRTQALLLGLGGFIPLGGRILEDFFGIDLFPKVDNIILLFFVSGVLFALAIFRYGALNIVHIAHGLVIQNIGAGIIVLDMLERVVELNPYAQQLVGQARGSVVGQVIGTALPTWPKLPEQVDAETEMTLALEGADRCFHIQRTQIKTDNGVPAGYTVVLLDITARKQAERQLEALARTDALTSLTNRRYFYELAEAELARAQRYQKLLTIILFDIDHFKQINDTYGHPAGDAVLKAVATECQQSLRTTDSIARFGGEEFIVLLAEDTVAGTLQMAERLRQVVESLEILVEQKTIRVTISLGLAHLFQGQDLTLDALIKQADDRLYKSKTSGRNRVSAGEPSLSTTQ